MLKRTLLVIASAISLCVHSYSEEVKPCEFCGSFYPKDAQGVAAAIDQYLAEVPAKEQTGDIYGIVVPHAGYEFSGKIAGHSFKAVEGLSFDAVIVMASSHQHHFSGIGLCEGSIKTPLGTLSVDRDITGTIATLDFAHVSPELFVKEHPVEVELPFIQKTIGNVKIVPILFGRVSFDEIKRLAARLADISRNKKILLVASTDMSHYHPYQEAVEIDKETLSMVEKGEIDRLWVSEEYNEGRACGIAPLTAWLLYAQSRSADIGVLAYANSGDTSGQKDKVVGYMSVVASNPARADVKNGPNNKEAAMSYSLSDDDKKMLLKIARTTLESRLSGKKDPAFQVQSKSLLEKRGVFVTLKKHGELRGCIGRLVADTPVYEAVSQMAIEAALHDPRFSPVDKKELQNLEIEISVLTPFEPVGALDEIEVGTHGLLIRKGFSSGLLLPQVPAEYGWDRKTFLEHTCLKAGLPAGAYQEKEAQLYKFSAIVFGEKDFSK